MNKPFKRLTARTNDRRGTPFLLPLVPAQRAVERLAAYEETGLDPTGVQALQLLWRTLLKTIVDSAEPLKGYPGQNGLVIADDMLAEFRKELDTGALAQEMTESARLN